jgi:hypothetical protein
MRHGQRDTNDDEEASKFDPTRRDTARRGKKQEKSENGAPEVASLTCPLHVHVSLGAIAGKVALLSALHVKKSEQRVWCILPPDGVTGIPRTCVLAQRQQECPRPNQCGAGGGCACSWSRGPFTISESGGGVRDDCGESEVVSSYTSSASWRSRCSHFLYFQAKSSHLPARTVGTAAASTSSTTSASAAASPATPSSAPAVLLVHGWI